ncbi:MAG: hypothetical protein ACIAS6_12400 [Phycisphaerales bacterium JB060]
MANARTHKPGSWRRRSPLSLTLLLSLLLSAGYPAFVGLPVPGSQQQFLPERDLETLRQKAQEQLASAQGMRSPVRLVLRTGEYIDGELVAETAESVTLQIAGIRTVFDQSRIERLVRLPDLATRYRDWRTDIDDADVNHVEQLIQWLAGEELYHVAHYEAAKLAINRPRDPRVDALLRRMRGMAELFEQRGQGVARDPSEREKPLPLLTREQVNLIRVYELDLLDPPRIRISPRDIQDFLLAYREDPRVPQTPEGRQAMIAGDPVDVLRLMFELKAREYYGKVRVLDDPDTVKRFRRDVTAWLVPGCATSRCHGGTEAGSLRLEYRNARGEAQAYTNFLVLTRATLEDGTPLINLDEPDESPLLHLGLRRMGSRFPHPEVPVDEGDGDAWREVFPRAEDARWRATTAWIRSLYQPRPDYPIEYPPAREAQGARGDPEEQDVSEGEASPGGSLDEGPP